MGSSCLCPHESLFHSHFLFLLVSIFQKSGKETILEEEFEFKGIEEEEEEESFADMERNSADGDKDKGEERFWIERFDYSERVSPLFHPILPSHGHFLKFSSFPSLLTSTESKEAGSAVIDGETKPASPSTSPPIHCTPPSLELPGGPVVDNTQLSNSHPAKAGTTTSEGTPNSTSIVERHIYCTLTYQFNLVE